MNVGQSFTSTGLLHVIVGIINPSSPVHFTVKGYEYWLSSSNYGINFKGNTSYGPEQATGSSLMRRGQMKIYPFFTKIYSAGGAPIRMGFKLSSKPSLPVSLSFNSGYFLLLVDNVNLPAFSKFECAIRVWSRQPTASPQTPFLNSYRSYKQRTQHHLEYVNCHSSPTNLTTLFLDVPRNLGIITDSTYYEIVIMPASSSTAGFPNSAVPLFKLLALPDSCEHIDELVPYTPLAFDLDMILLVSS